MSRRDTSWFSLGMDAWNLGLESSMVIGLRTMKIAAGGPAAETESRRMVEEKVEAAVALQQMAMTGMLGASAPEAAKRTMAHYRRKVSANRRRLSKP